MFYLIINGQRSGPYTADEVRSYFLQGAVGPETQFWTDGMMGWQPIGARPDIFGLSYSTPPRVTNPGFGPSNYMYQPAPQAPVYIQQVVVQQSKSRAAYIVLGLFLGGLGIHNFYAGHTSRGVIQLLLNLFLFWTIIVPVGIGIWVLIEVIAVDSDGYGYRMR